MMVSRDSGTLFLQGFFAIMMWLLFLLLRAPALEPEESCE